MRIKVKVTLFLGENMKNARVASELCVKISLARSLGIKKVINLLWQKLFKPTSFFSKNSALFKGKGIEIGGPSGRFCAGGVQPIYMHATEVDNVNFSDVTRWEGRIHIGKNFIFNPKRKAGLQLVHEADNLISIKNNTYDFLISSHMLEHSANPIKVLIEWKRVIKEQGVLLLVLPHKDSTFDQYRPVTKLSHIIEDYKNDVDENDRTHFSEILSLHDLQRDPGQKSFEDFRTWIEENSVNRGAHHHVFNSLSAAMLVNYIGFEILCIEPIKPYDICIFAKKPPADIQIDNSEFLKPSSSYLRFSPFKSDHACQSDLTG